MKNEFQLSENHEVSQFHYHIMTKSRASSAIDLSEISRHDFMNRPLSQTRSFESINSDTRRINSTKASQIRIVEIERPKRKSIQLQTDDSIELKKIESVPKIMSRRAQSTVTISRISRSSSMNSVSKRSSSTNKS